MGHLLGTVGMLNQGVTFNLGSAKVFAAAVFETYFSYHKHIWIGATDCYVLLHLL